MSIAHNRPKCPRRSKRNVIHAINLALRRFNLVIAVLMVDWIRLF